MKPTKLAHSRFCLFSKQKGEAFRGRLQIFGRCQEIALAKVVSMLLKLMRSGLANERYLRQLSVGLCCAAPNVLNSGKSSNCTFREDSGSDTPEMILWDQHP